jgi:hypothetical protein
MADLTPYIAGAGTTLVAQAVLQLYVVPRVELRKRREDRWEKAVVDLGALLGEAVLDAHHEAVQATLTQYVRRPEDSRSNEVVSEAAAVSMRSHRQLVNTRVRIAAEHVVGLDPEAPSLLAFASALNKYRSAVGALALYARTRQAQLSGCIPSCSPMCGTWREDALPERRCAAMWAA